MMEFKLKPDSENREAISFCNAFIHENASPKFVMGRNEYARSIIDAIDLDGVIDDYTEDRKYENLTIYKKEQIPKNSYVVSALLGRPLTGATLLNEHDLKNLDYFSFLKYSHLEIKPVEYLIGFKNDVDINGEKYHWVYTLLEDEVSKKTFYDILHFRYHCDIRYMAGYQDLQHKQYFEPFLNLSVSGEVFVDAGASNGCTSKRFIKHYPEYESVHILEPFLHQLNEAQHTLQNHSKVWFHPLGLWSSSKTAFFELDGRSSKIIEAGEEQINLVALDDLMDGKVTFIKLDIEGAEIAAIEGARKTIQKWHPKMAICVYHKKDDLWRIPELVLSIYPDYKIYLRHYTEGIYETVMFFVPTNG